MERLVERKVQGERCRTRRIQREKKEIGGEPPGDRHRANGSEESAARVRREEAGEQERASAERKMQRRGRRMAQTEGKSRPQTHGPRDRDILGLLAVTRYLTAQQAHRLAFDGRNISATTLGQRPGHAQARAARVRGAAGPGA